MNLNFKRELVENYHGKTQIARILTETWMEENMFCPRCGYLRINHFPNNRPVADFYCPNCKCEFELKSKHGRLSEKVNDGAYSTMIERITSNQNPDFFFMGYDENSFQVRDLIMIPKHFFVPNIIEKRKPLSKNARRAGWTGCNILISKVPEQGRIRIVDNGIVTDAATIVDKVSHGKALEILDINARGWVMDILICMNMLPGVDFSLNDMYSFEDWLKQKHPQNNNVKPKIRQQLQMLRDKGLVEFLGNGHYRKIV